MIRNNKNEEVILEEILESVVGGSISKADIKRFFSTRVGIVISAVIGALTLSCIAFCGYKLKHRNSASGAKSGTTPLIAVPAEIPKSQNPTSGVATTTSTAETIVPLASSTPEPVVMIVPISENGKLTQDEIDKYAIKSYIVDNGAEGEGHLEFSISATGIMSFVGTIVAYEDRSGRRIERQQSASSIISRVPLPPTPTLKP